MAKDMTFEEVEKRKESISNLVTTYYNRNAFLKKKRMQLNNLIDKAIEKYLYSDLSMDEIEKEIVNIINGLKDDYADIPMNKFDNEEKDEKLEKNSTVINFLNDLNNSNVDYKVTGLTALSFEKENGTNNLSFYVNEKDFDKFKTVCEKNGFSFVDMRNNTKRQIENGNVIGDANVSASSNNDSTKVDVKGFERLNDNSIIVKDDFINSNGEHCIKADFYGKDLAKEIFESDSINVNGNTYPVVAPEFDYISRRNSSDKKDKDIVSELKSEIDINRVEKIQNLANTNFASQITKAPQEKKQDNELSSMLIEEEKKSVQTNETIQKDKPKQFVKNNNTSYQSTNTNNGGYVSKLAFIFFMLLTVVILLTGFLLLNM